MAWGWIKKIKDFGSKAINKAGSVIKAGKQLLSTARPQITSALDRFGSAETQQKGYSWLDKAESFLGRADQKIDKYRGRIEPRYRGGSRDDDYD
jgi:hypothetical protein